MSTMPRLRPSQVLGMQAELRERFQKPNAAMLDWLQGMANTERNRERWQMMFYPYSPQEGGVQAAAYSRAIARALFSGQTYQVTEQMVDVLESVYWNTLKEGAEEAIEEDTLPSRAGFLWYDRPAELQERTGKMISIRAISWSPETFHTPVTNGFGQQIGTRTEDGIRMVFWQRAGDPGDYPDVLEEQVSELGDLVINHTIVCPFGEHFPLKLSVLPDGTSKPGNSVLHWIWVTWLLLDTEIAATSKQRPEQHSRRAKQVARSLRHDEVSVITLRRTSKRPGSDHVVQHRDVDWTCCWIVARFWRHLESYDEALFKPGHQARTDKGTPPRCTVCGAKITRVKSHMRGPDWLPLKNPDKVYLLRR